MANERLVAAGSAKWTTAFMKPADLDDLRASIATVAPRDRPQLFLFARSGFDPNLRAEPDVFLVRLADLYRADLEYERVRP
jgi:hypothetical protein